MYHDLVEKLAYQGRQYESGSRARGGPGRENIMTEAADAIQSLQQQLVESEQARAELIEILRDLRRKPDSYPMQAMKSLLSDAYEKHSPTSKEDQPIKA